MEITEEQYNNAKEIVTQYILNQSEISVKDPELLMSTIKQREDYLMELKENVEYLMYDNNPIGGRKDMLNMIKSNSLQQIIEINIIVEKILKSFCEK
jgi:uncharacterized phage-like protein YoqJ